MVEYESAFTDNSEIVYSPYLMYTNPKNYKSNVVNTDADGIRLSDSKKVPISNILLNSTSYNILVGSSTVFGIGSSSDKQTISSQLENLSGQPTINLGGRSYNSLQEFIYFYLFSKKYNDYSPRNVISLTGFNDLALSNISLNSNSISPAFFMQNPFIEQLSMKKWGKKLPYKFRVSNLNHEKNINHKIDKRILYSVESMKKYIDFMEFYCRGIGSSYAFALQPLFNWIEKLPSNIEEMIFNRLEEAGRFEDIYGEITTREVYKGYEKALEEHCNKRGVYFISITKSLKELELCKEDSIFVDRIHFNDFGSQLIAKILLRKILSNKS